MENLTITPILRKFKVGMQLLDDPCPGADVQTVIRVLAVAHPEVTTAAMSGPVIEGEAEVYSFTRSIGTKG